MQDNLNFVTPSIRPDCLPIMVDNSIEQFFMLIIFTAFPSFITKVSYCMDFSAYPDDFRHSNAHEN